MRSKLVHRPDSAAAPARSTASGLEPGAPAQLASIVAWYLDTAYGRWEGPGTVPFFADPSRVGRFAVDLARLQRREPGALFKLLVTLGAYQSRRDVDIMRIQRSMSQRQVGEMTSLRQLRVLVEGSRCSYMRDAERFDAGCSVRRDQGRGATCAAHPRMTCHVKDATSAIGRMGDLGKQPTSAWLRLGSNGPMAWFGEAVRVHADPRRRAIHLVELASSVHRIGVKLASMYVTALSVPELGSGAAWSPEIDGSQLLVVDANVRSAIRIWRRNRGPETYDALATWLSRAANKIDLARLHPGLPSRSPRLVQQALYLFRSRSNRTALGDRCASRPCGSCPSSVCPFRSPRRST